MDDRLRSDALLLFDQVAEMTTASQAAELRRACGDDDALRASVEALLDADRAPHGLLDVPPGGLVADAARESGPHFQGRRMGPYRIIRELGRGGMGVVYLAERDDVRSRVALKVVPVMGSGFALSRFEHEKRALARLEHPNIARFLDAGVEPDGTPWMAMEYVQGDRIDAYCNRAGRTLDERLELFEKVCDAVAYAHGRLLVHRDIKPSNVLVTSEGVPKLVDFGIATLLRDDDRSHGTLTLDHGRPMTPDYASPEQLRGARATTSSDVYQLGLLLHVLLTGRCPSAPGGACLGGLARLAAVEPVLPSRLPEVRPLRRFLEGDLDTIVMTALRDEPGARYASAAGLAADIRRFRQRRPIEARPATLGYRFRKLVLRHKVVATLAFAMLWLVVGSAAALAVQARRVWMERDHAQAAAAVLEEVLRYADPTATGRDSLASLSVLGGAAASVRRELPRSPRTWAPVLVGIGDVYRNRGLPDTALAVWREAVDALSQAGLAHDPALIDALGAIGALHVTAGRFDLGLAYLEDAVGRARRVAPDRRVGLASSLADLGFGRQVAGEPDAAEALYRDATDLLLTLPDSGSGHLERILVNRGFLASSRHAYEEAEAFFREAATRRARALGPTHTRTLNAKTALARALLTLGRLEEADLLSHEVLRARRDALGEPHPSLADGLGVRAEVLAALGDVDAAVALGRESVAVFEASLGREHVQTGYALMTLGGILGDAGRVDEALLRERDAVAVYERTFGPDHPFTANVRLTLAGTELEAGNRDAAGAQLERALAPSQQPGADGRALLIPMIRLGRILAGQGRCDEAIPHLRHALKLLPEGGRDGWPGDRAGEIRAELGRCGVT